MTRNANQSARTGSLGDRGTKKVSSQRGNFTAFPFFEQVRLAHFEGENPNDHKDSDPVSTQTEVATHDPGACRPDQGIAGLWP